MEADITTKTQISSRNTKNFEIVRKKLLKLKNVITYVNFNRLRRSMGVIQLKTIKEIGMIKEAIKEAILEGEI
jgi:tRNA nucleotidyltransferase (CCA-adding enzyme)